MSIEYVYGDLLAAQVEALANPVNCVGVMGKGLALQFKRAYPKMVQEYAAVCRSPWFRPGSVFMYLVPGKLEPRYVLCVATKDHYRDASRLEWIQAGVLNIYNLLVKYNIRSIAIPALGCGEGGLPWEAVQDVIHEGLSSLDEVQVLVYPPHAGVATQQADRRALVSAPVF